MIYVSLEGQWKVDRKLQDLQKNNEQSRQKKNQEQRIRPQNFMRNITLN